jgi:hypothetical protein
MHSPHGHPDGVAGVPDPRPDGRTGDGKARPGRPRADGAGPYPGGARFAFTIIDDTDVATRENVEPVYRLLRDLGMGATKTVWPLDCPEGSGNFWLSETLEDSHYLEFAKDLVEWGFELGWHGATMESSRRERTVRGLERFREVFGHLPDVFANHSANREGLYWGGHRVDDPLLRRLYERVTGRDRDEFSGHVEGSPYWWGDLALEHFRYGRNLTFNDINTLKLNPSMPYRDPRRPLVPRWFSATDAEGVDEFNHLLRTENQERLEAEGGVCIVATHLGKGFAPDGRLNPTTRRRLEALARRPGWFPGTGELLRWLESRRDTAEIPAGEWWRMQWRWAWDLLSRRLRAKYGRPTPSPQALGEDDDAPIPSERGAAGRHAAKHRQGARGARARTAGARPGPRPGPPDGPHPP